MSKSLKEQLLPHWPQFIMVQVNLDVSSTSDTVQVNADDVMLAGRYYRRVPGFGLPQMLAIAIRFYLPQ